MWWARVMMEGGCGLGHMLPRRQDVMGENGGGDRWWVEVVVVW